MMKADNHLVIAKRFMEIVGSGRATMVVRVFDVVAAVDRNMPG